MLFVTIVAKQAISNETVRSFRAAHMVITVVGFLVGKIVDALDLVVHVGLPTCLLINSPPKALI